MKLKLVGFVHNRGRGVNKETGEVFDFDSVALDCLTAMSPKGQNVVAHGGQHYKKVKFKACDLAAIFGGAVSQVSELASFVGSEIYVDGTQFSNASGTYVNAEEIRLA